MIETSSELTLSLAKAAGVYFIVGGMSGFIARHKWHAILDEFEKSAALTFLAGIVIYVFGVVIILAHNIWTDTLSGFISIFGWVAAFEGLVIILFPDPLLRFSKSLMRPGFITAFAGFTIAFGALLLFAGFTGMVR